MGSNTHNPKDVIAAGQMLNPVLLSIRSSMRLHRTILIGESIGAAVIAIWLGVSASVDHSSTLMRLTSSEGLIRLLIAAVLIILAPVAAFLAARKLPKQMKEAAECIVRLRSGDTEGVEELTEELSAASRYLKLGIALSVGFFLAGLIVLLRS